MGAKTGDRDLNSIYRDLCKKYPGFGQLNVKEARDLLREEIRQLEEKIKRDQEAADNGWRARGVFPLRDCSLFASVIERTGAENTGEMIEMVARKSIRNEDERLVLELWEQYYSRGRGHFATDKEFRQLMEEFGCG